ncbi:MAG TPA: MarR family transcriptional regulator [Candidatus Acidoferrales bacterium]|nr:MarR family transcriptional regulator [Candidatus Acidoferrales bacterium]
MTPANCMRSLEEFRYRIRRFLDFSRRAARAAGLAPQQHQMLLVIAGGPAETGSSIRLLADRLYLNHNSTVELLNRLERQGMVRRIRKPEDRRQVGVRITRGGQRVLARLTRHHLTELRTAGPELVRALQAAIAGARRAPRSRARSRGGKR